MPHGNESAALVELAMDELEYHAKLDELDHLLNDPDIEFEPSHIWALLAEVSRHDLQALAKAPPAA
jgi:hypothetical protein